MIRVVVAPFGLKIKSPILTRRGGKDANAPERHRAAILRDWNVGILGPVFFFDGGGVWKKLSISDRERSDFLCSESIQRVFPGP